MKKCQSLSILLIAMLMSSVSSAEDLMQVYDMALKSDPQLLAEMASRQAVAEQQQQAKARFLPNIALKANTGRVWQDTSARLFSGSVVNNNHGFTLSLSQPIYHRENFVQKEQATIAIDSEKASYQIVDQALIVRVATRYFDLLGKQDDLTFAISERKAIAQQLDQTQQRFDVGLATITDVVESQAAYDLANASVISAENEVANSKERLRETSGKYLDSVSQLNAESPLISPEPEDINKWSEVALVQNPNLIVVKKSVDNAGQVIELQKSGHYPSLDIVAQKDYSSQSDTVIGGGRNQTQQKSISLQFNLPIYEGGSVQSKTREAEHRLDQAMQKEEQQRRLVVRQSHEAYNSVMSGISSVKALKQAVASNQKALESTEAGYEVGTRTTVDVLNVRRDLFRAKRDYASARYNYILASLRLKQAAGTVSVDDLKNINQWLGK